MPWTEDAVPIPEDEHYLCERTVCEREARIRLPGGQKLCPPCFQYFEFLLAHRPER
jgi:hypothetical protein